MYSQEEINFFKDQASKIIQHHVENNAHIWTLDNGHSIKQISQADGTVMEIEYSANQKPIQKWTKEQDGSVSHTEYKSNEQEIKRIARRDGSMTEIRFFGQRKQSMTTRNSEGEIASLTLYNDLNTLFTKILNTDYSKAGHGAQNVTLQKKQDLELYMGEESLSAESPSFAFIKQIHHGAEYKTIEVHCGGMHQSTEVPYSPAEMKNQSSKWGVVRQHLLTIVPKAPKMQTVVTFMHNLEKLHSSSQDPAAAVVKDNTC